MDERGAIERTRALIERRLGVAMMSAPRDAYRETDAFAGDWLGAFAQPGVILNAATVVRASFDERVGKAVDEYGESSLVVVQHEADRVVLRKRYANKPATGEFMYVGRLADGALAGYWYSTLRPQFCGVFWMSRADRLADATRTSLETRVRARSVRRGIVYTLAALVAAAGLAGIAGYTEIAIIAFLVVLLARYVLLGRMDAMTKEVKLWQKALAK